jgi:hypothetical protein
MGVRIKSALLCLMLLATTSSSGNSPFTRTECAELPVYTPTLSRSVNADDLNRLQREVERQNQVIRCLQREVEKLKTSSR